MGKGNNKDNIANKPKTNLLALGMVAGFFSWLVLGNHQRGENHQPVSVSTDGVGISGHREALAVTATGSEMRENPGGRSVAIENRMIID